MLGWLSCPLWHLMTFVSHLHVTLDPVSQDGLLSKSCFSRGRVFFCLFILLTVLMVSMPLQHSVHVTAHSPSTNSTQMIKVPFKSSVSQRWVPIEFVKIQPNLPPKPKEVDMKSSIKTTTTPFLFQVKSQLRNGDGGFPGPQEPNASIRYRPFAAADAAHKRDRISSRERKGTYLSTDTPDLLLHPEVTSGVAIPKAIGVKERLKAIAPVPETPSITLQTSSQDKFYIPSPLRETLNTEANWKSIGVQQDLDGISFLANGRERREEENRLSMNTNEVLKTGDVPWGHLQTTPAFPFAGSFSYHKNGYSYGGTNNGTITGVLNSSAPHIHRLSWIEEETSHYELTNDSGSFRKEDNEPKLINVHSLLRNLESNKREQESTVLENEASTSINKVYEMDIFPPHSSTKYSPLIRTYRDVSEKEAFVRKKSQRKNPQEKEGKVAQAKKIVHKVTSTEGTHSNQSATHRNKRKADMREVSVMEGGLAELPCDLQVSNPNDSVQLILWIKEGIHTPLYSYDYRELQGGRPKEMKPDVNSTLAQRTSFRTDRNPAALLIEKVEADDAGIYRCRADFSLSPTINRRVNLTVIVPPRRVKVSWRLEGSNVSKDVVDQVAGPFLEKAQPTLICINEDGWPPSSIKWFEDDLLLDDSYSVYLSKGFVENEITLRPLSRGDLGRRLSCQASNNNNTQPATTTVTVALTLGILGVRMEDIGRVWAGEKTEVECAVWGSRPLPTVVWWLGPHMKTPAETRVLDEGNLTISVLSFIPTPREDGVMLICQATNDDLPDQAVQDSRLLSVNYAPVVSIHLGTSLDPSMIKEGDDVYFECSVKAKPPAFKVVWKQNGHELSTGSGMFVANMSLVLQKITRSHAGQYSCEATNIKDTVTSTPINLDIKYTPVCIQPEKNYFAVARRESAVVSCQVEANPANVTFSWSFNNSAEAVHIPNDKFVVVGKESRVSYVPEDEMDYGTLQCRANNTIGMQSIPCLFKIIPAGKPDPPHNCRVSDVTISSLQVNCLPGDDGGLNQTFQLQVFKIGEEKKPVVEVQREKPTFSVANLRPATPYKIVIVAVNNMGPSRVSEIKTYTARVPESQQETNAEPTRDREREPAVPFVILIGGCVMLVPLVVVVAVLLRLKFCRSSGPKGSNSSRRRISSQSMDPPSTDIASDASGPVDECDPDILSHTPGVTCEQPPWQNPGEGDIATLPGTLYNPPQGGLAYPTNVVSHLPPTVASIHTPSHPGLLPPMHGCAMSSSQVPYYTDANLGGPMGKVTVLSPSSFTQMRQDVVPQGLDIQGYQQPLEAKAQHDPYSPFPHICYSAKGCVHPPPPLGSQYDISQLQETSIQQAPTESSCLANAQNVPKEFLQRRGSKKGDSSRSCQVHGLVPASTQVAVPSVVDSSMVIQSSTGHSPRTSIPGDTLRRQKVRGASGTPDVRTSAQADANENKVESRV